MSFAVEHHADRNTPSLPELPTRTDKQKQVLVSAIRDIDKFTNFQYLTDRYLRDEEYKQGQVLANKLDPKGEMGRIEPVSQLRQFLAGGTLLRAECRSYEAYMLQYLAWIYDVNFGHTLNEIVRTGAVDNLLAYFYQQLPVNDAQAIRRKTVEYLHTRGNVRA